MTHLFLALGEAPWGEVLYGLRIASLLRRRGDRVIFFARRTMALLFKDEPFEYQPIDHIPDCLRAVRETLKRERCDSLFLIDIALTFICLEVAKEDKTFVGELAVPVIGLDVWDLARTNLLMDHGKDGWLISRHCRDVTRRLIPSPMNRPGGVGVYNSLPEELPPPGARERLRERLGIGPDERLICFPVAEWQQNPAPESSGKEYLRRLARRFPSLLAHALERLGSRVRVVSVARTPIPELAALGRRHRWLNQLARRDYLSLLSASDLLLSFNAAASTIGTAALLGVPVLLGSNSFDGESAEDVVARLPFAPTAFVVDWLRTMAPLHRFRMWPIGLHGFTAETTRDNACLEMATSFEVLDEERFVSGARTLLFDEAARDEARRRMAACLEEVRRLPTADALVDQMLLPGRQPPLGL